MNQLTQLIPEKGVSLRRSQQVLFSGRSFCVQFVYHNGPLTLYNTDSSHDLGSNYTLGNVEVRPKMIGRKQNVTYSEKFYH